MTKTRKCLVLYIDKTYEDSGIDETRLYSENTDGRELELVLDNTSGRPAIVEIGWQSKVDWNNDEVFESVIPLVSDIKALPDGVTTKIQGGKLVAIGGSGGGYQSNMKSITLNSSMQLQVPSIYYDYDTDHSLAITNDKHIGLLSMNYGSVEIKNGEIEMMSLGEGVDISSVCLHSKTINHRGLEMTGSDSIDWSSNIWNDYIPTCWKYQSTT